jgi:hypothetical protein
MENQDGDDYEDDFEDDHSDEGEDFIDDDDVPIAGVRQVYVPHLTSTDENGMTIVHSLGVHATVRSAIRALAQASLKQGEY